ncbi:hypothetical protein Y032_0520g2857 [Ancylostoma ceylanicum]|uniref:Secreted protein n=1 Tax=Ancylostoma ceylanicum TaxID=53326 RepID=A0A016WUP1_9BILA|nr:hypothetical protein Y032_0520g2857 [Ancylostoma ceylanicum]
MFSFSPSLRLLLSIRIILAHVYTTGRRSGGVLLHSRMVFCIEKGVCFLLIPYVKSMKSYENVHDDGYGSTEILHNDRSSRANVQENI